MENNKCGCWVVFRKSVRSTCKPSASKDTLNTIPRTSLVYDVATETRYLNASNQEMCAPNEAQNSTDNTDPLPLESKAPCQLLQFTFQELKSATGNFRPDSILGEGGFGYVFKGWIEETGTVPAKPGSGMTVAVKSLKPDDLQGHREWVAEVDFLGQLHHPNLVKLVRYCIEDDQRLLVYEFMTRGSLENHIFRMKMDNFIELWAIKTILEYNAKLSDFGLAKAGPQGDKTHVSTRVVGTYGYAAPEYVMTDKASCTKQANKQQSSIQKYQSPRNTDQLPRSAVIHKTEPEGLGSQQFAGADDWGMDLEFGGGNETGGTTELEGLPPPPAGVSASAAKK
ncbi:hypothetical protein ACSBR1_011443 [Camellia fascicularis]